jgi:hypothetical protein
MTLRSVTYLKGVFETNDIPTGTDYSDIFDSFLSLHATAAQTVLSPTTFPSVTTTNLTVTGQTINSYVSANPSGTTQGLGVNVSADIAFLSVSDPANRAVRLENFSVGRQQTICNSFASVTALSIFPASGVNFMGTAANAHVLLAAGQTLIATHVAASVMAYGRF